MVIIERKFVAQNHVGRKIIKETRNSLVVQNANGETEVYSILRSAPKTPKSTRKPKVKKVSLEQMVASLPQCSVILERLPQQSMEAKIDEDAGEEKAKEVGALVRFPRKIFYILFYVYPESV